MNNLLGCHLNISLIVMTLRNELHYQPYNNFQLTAFADIQAEDVLTVSYPGSDDQPDYS